MSFPLKFKDLAPLSRLSIEIYNLDQEDEKPIASTMIDLFD